MQSDDNDELLKVVVEWLQGAEPWENNSEWRLIMKRSENLYAVESKWSVNEFVEKFTSIARANDFVVNNMETMDMKKTFREHGGEVSDHFDLHMIQVCKPTKADKSLTSNPERAIMMPKFVHVFSRDNRTQVRYLSYSNECIEDFVPDDPTFAQSVGRTFSKIRAMIDEAV